MQGLAILFCTVLLLAACASQKPSIRTLPAKLTRDEAIGRSRTAIIESMKEFKIPGISVVVADAAGIVMVDAFGESDKGKAFTVDTISNIGSVSKLFTGFAIMRLAETGRLDLDAPLSRYLPDFKPYTWGPNPDGISIRSVMAHLSGIQSDLLGSDRMLAAAFKDAPARPYADNARLVSQTTLCYEPYTIGSYSNLAVSLLALVVEKASGASFNDYVYEQVFKPTGMRVSSFVYKSELANLYARGMSGKSWVDIPAIRDSAAGGMTSSASDLGKFLLAVLRTHGKGVYSGTGGIVRPETLKTMWTQENSQTTMDLDKIQMLSWYALRSGTVPEKLYYTHGGDLPPFHATVLIDPALDLGVSLLMNGGLGGSGTLDSIGKEILRLFALALHGETAEPRPVPVEAKPVPLDKKNAAGMSGSYASENGLVIVEKSGTQLIMKVAGITLRLEQVADNEFRIKKMNPGFTANTAPGSQSPRASMMTIYGKEFIRLSSSAGSQILEKISPLPVHASWLARAGTWQAADTQPGGGLSISQLRLQLDKKTGLFLAYLTMREGSAKQTAVYPLASRGPQEIYLRGYGRNLGTTIRVVSEKNVEYLDVLGVRLVRK